MTKILGILGAGHLGKQIAHYAIKDGHYTDIVFFDDYTKLKEVDDYHVVGNESDIQSAFRNGVFDELIIGIGYKHMEIRKNFFQKYFESVPFGTIIHSTCYLDPTAIVNVGSILYPYSCIDKNVIIGFNTVVNLSCTISHDSIVGNHCFLAPRQAIAGFVKIKELCFMGINTTIIDCISISEKTHLGAGSVVIKDVDIPGLYVGNPIRLIRLT